MTETQDEKLVREAVGIFDDAETLQEAVDELESHGFDRAELSLLAGEKTVEEKLGHVYQRAAELEDDPNAPRAAFVNAESLGAAEGGLIGGFLYVMGVAAAGAVVASGGALAAILSAGAMAGGTGALIGTVLALVVGEHHADFLQTQLDRGGLLLWVHTRDAEHEAKATEILSKHSAHDVHVHGLAA